MCEKVLADPFKTENNRKILEHYSIDVKITKPGVRRCPVVVHYAIW